MRHAMHWPTLALVTLTACACTRGTDDAPAPLREAFDAPPAGIATAATRQANAAVLADIRALSDDDLERARRGLVARHPDADIRDGDGNVVWRRLPLRCPIPSTRRCGGNRR